MKFEIYAEDEQEPLLLTPHLWKSWNRRNGNAGGCIGFFDRQFHVAVDINKNSFEPPVFSAITPQLNEIRKGG
ncbi:MAG: DUF3137 domain-containing protein [Holdemania massiliensis]